MYECLKNVVNLIKEVDDTCIISDEFTGQSLSGFYVDDTTRGRIPVTAAFYNNETKLNQLIPDAVNETMYLIRNAIESKLLKKYSNHYIKIGNVADANGYLTASGKQNDFLCIRANGIRGIILTINKIKIRLKNGLYSGEIILLQDETELYSGNVTEFVPMTVNLNKPLYISYATESANEPQNFKHTGCCGSVPAYSPFLQVGSGSFDDIDLPVWTKSDYCNGIELDGYVDCDGFSFLCDGETATIDFQRSNFGRLVAKMIQLVARRNIGAWILTDNNLTPYKIAQDEEIGLAIEYCNLEIEKMLNFIHQTYDFSDCYICSGIYKTSIII